MKAILIFSMLFSAASWAGTEDHGGDSVVCYEDSVQGQKIVREIKNEILAQKEQKQKGLIDRINISLDYSPRNQYKSVQSFDLWLAQERGLDSRNQLIDFANKDKDQILDFILNRLAQRSNLTAILESIELTWIGGSSVGEVDDNNKRSNLLPSHCLTVQVARQLTSENVVEFSRPLYNKMTEADKAALVLHEKLVNFARPNDTYYIHDLISVLFATDEVWQKVNAYDFRVLVESISQGIHIFMRVPVFAGKTHMQLSNRIVATDFNTVPNDCPHQAIWTLEQPASILVNGSQIQLPAQSYLGFFDKRFEKICGFSSGSGNQFNLSGQIVNTRAYTRFYFSREGFIQKIEFPQSIEVHSTVYLSAWQADLKSDGLIHQIKFWNGGVISRNGQPIHEFLTNKFNEAFLDETGRLTHAYAYAGEYGRFSVSFDHDTQVETCQPRSEYKILPGECQKKLKRRLGL